MSTKMSRLWKPLLGTNWSDPLELDLKNIICLINIKTKIQNSHIFKRAVIPLDPQMRSWNWYKSSVKKRLECSGKSLHI